jgi:small subunit ribosomal protein S8
MFANIKNGQTAKKSIIIQTRKNMCEHILKLLWDEGFISGYKISLENNQKLEIFLKYQKTGKPTINSIKTISKPGKRIYYSAKQIWKMDSSKLFIIFSTNKGLKSITQCKKFKLGGEAFLIIS